MIFNSECTQVQDELDEMAKGLPIIATGLLERSLTQIVSRLFELFIFWLGRGKVLKNDG